MYFTLPPWLASKPSLNEKLVETHFRPSGFDYMRLLLACSVIVYHSVVTTYGMNAQQEVIISDWRPLIAGVLPMFFALSGFLVAGSLERTKSIITFLGLRVLRIVPALAVEVLLSALIMGPLLTTLTLQSYFSDPQFYRYFWNILGNIHYELPGLFPNNPYPHTVNGQLWTVPWELACYMLITVLSLLGIFKKRKWLLFFVIGCYLAHFVKMIVKLSVTLPPYQGGSVHGHTLVMIFAAGLLIYRYRDRIPYSGWLCVLSLIMSLLLLAAPPNGDGFIALPITYVTVYLGLMNPPRNKIMLSGDYSYGIFLYGYPLQQVISSIPALQHWYLNLLAALPCVLIVAACSWLYIEKPCLGMRKYLKTFEDWRLVKSK